MRFLLAFLVLAVCCAISANGFLFKKKPKTGCDPNPCKHKGTCELDDPKDKMQFHCTCPDDYHGKKCEIKSGCHKKTFGGERCGKHGTCYDDAVDQKKYHCKCENGYVGKDCDEKNLCILKNPCKSGSVCSLDKKHKPVCECEPGFGGKKCDKRDCTIVEYKGKNIEALGKKSKVFIDKEIQGKYKKMDNLAKLCGVTIKVSKSFMKLVNPTDMPKNNDAMFFIGRGLKFEVWDKKGKKAICDEKCLKKVPVASKEAQCFINGLDAIYWKYSSYLPGIVHDGFHVANFGDLNKLKAVKQVGCQQIKKLPVVKGRDHLVVDYKPSGSKKCPTGLAGPDCKKDDLCVKKNPCKKGSTCTLNAKLKPVCGCANGFGGSKCNKKNCTITSWKGKQFGGGWFHTKIYISEDRKKNFEKLDQLAKMCKVKFDVLGSFKKNNDPKYKIDEKSPFYIGYGIDVELLDAKGKLLCNKVCLGKKVALKEVNCLLDGLDAIDFKHNRKYPGIIYDGSMLTETGSSYLHMKEFKQVGCSGEKFYKKL